MQYEHARAAGSSTCVSFGLYRNVERYRDRTYGRYGRNRVLSETYILRAKYRCRGATWKNTVNLD
jgi:hypothetical protein